MKVFSIPLNPKLSAEEFKTFYSFVERNKGFIYDIYFTTRINPFIQDAMGDILTNEASHIAMNNALVFQEKLGIPLSATFNNIEISPTQEALDLWIQEFKPLYDWGIRTVTLPHTLWLLSGEIQNAFPELYMKNTILRNVQRPNELVELVKAGFSYINLDRDLMRDSDTLLKIKEAKEYCTKKYGREIKVSLLTNEGCWGNCSVQDEHFTYNNTRIDHNQPTYFKSSLSKYSCPAWSRDDPATELKKANFPPWKEDWMELHNDYGIDVFKMHGRESYGRLEETMMIIDNFREDKELLFDGFSKYTHDLHIENSPINVWRNKIKNCKFDCWKCHYCEDVIDNKTKHRYITQINKALSNSDKGISKLSTNTLMIPGLTSHKVKHFINNLVDMVDIRYLEIGTFQGAIFTAAIEGNNIIATGIDNFKSSTISPMVDKNKWGADKGDTETILKNNIFRVNPGVETNIINKNVEDITREDLPLNYNVLFYDGDHSTESHHDTLVKLWPYLEQTFVLIVDDWNWEGAHKGTKIALDKLNANLLYTNEIFTSGEDHKDYWNGLGIFVINK